MPTPFERDSSILGPLGYAGIGLCRYWALPQPLKIKIWQLLQKQN